MDDVFAWAERLWPHQRKALNEVANGISTQGWRSLLLHSPCGGGKTAMAIELMKWWLATHDSRVCFYTNRRILTSQVHDALTEAGIEHGVRAAGWIKNDAAPVQICAIQTELARVKAGFWEQPDAGLCFFDEAHLLGSEEAVRLIFKHRTNGAVTIGLSATPVELDHVYDRLVVAGKNSELRACGAHVPCQVFAPDEPAVALIKRQASGEYSESDIRKVFRCQTVIGRILEHFKALNPDKKPTIVFGPGVSESLWLCDQFIEAGYTACHIDCNDVYLGEKDADGEPKLYKSNPDLRKQVLDDVRAGQIQVVCNRFVLREGVDIRELEHMILATPVGSMASFVQMVGRIQRACEGKTKCVLQDHAGNFWRHGSPNADREWDMSKSAKDMSDDREDRIRDKKEPEPIVCPKCHAVRLKGPSCHACGHTCTTRSRVVVQLDGTLQEVRGDILPPRKVVVKPDSEKKWISTYFRGRASKMTFRQCEGLFFVENGYYPNRDFPYMPKRDVDMHRRVRDVPKTDLK